MTRATMARRYKGFGNSYRRTARIWRSFLERAGFTVYFPRILGQRRVCESLFRT